MRIARIKKSFFKSVAGVLALSAFMALLSPTIDAATLEKINASYGADARFVNELESAGFFDELNRQYGK